MASWAVHEAIGARHPLLADGRLRPIYSYTVRNGNAINVLELLQTKCKARPRPKWLRAMLNESGGVSKSRAPSAFVH